MQPIGVVFVVIGVAEVGVTAAKITVAILQPNQLVVAVNEVRVLAKML